MIELDALMAPNSGSVDPSRFPDETFDLYSIAAFDNGRAAISLGREIGSSKQVVQSNDVLLSRIVPHIRRAWVVGGQRGYRQIASGEWIVFRSAKTHPSYLRYLLVEDRFHAKFMKTVAGVGGSLLRARPAQVADIEVPLPSLSAQKRIAGQLEQADRQVRTRRYALELSDTFLPAAFIQLFGDPKQNPNEWPEQTLSSACSKFSDGPFGSNLKSSDYRPSGVRVVRLQNIGVGEFLDDDKAFVSKEHFAALQKHTCIPGDVLIGTMGDPNLRACIQPAHIPIALNKADCIQARPDPKHLNALYVQGLLNIPSTLHLVPGMVHGQTRARVSMGELARLPIPVPPLPLQQKFAALVERVERLRAVQREALRQAEHLFASLLHRAFSG